MGEATPSPTLSLPHAASPPAARPGYRLGLVYSLIFLISLADALTAAGVVVGILLGVPIVIASLFEEPRHVLVTGGTSLLCFVLAAILVSGPYVPGAIWIPNRVLAMLSIGAFTWLSVELQRRRRELAGARCAAESARDLSRLLHSLMAHDLRTPLVLARQGFEAVRTAAAGGVAPDLVLTDELDARLTHSLRTIELVLDAARGDLGETLPSLDALPVPIARELDEEIATFRKPAGMRGKTLEVQVVPPDLVLRTHAEVLRQGVSILVDNAIRYARPGPVTVLAQAHGGVLWVHVRDSGPSDHGRAPEEPRSGIGLRLCRLLAARAGGSLQVMREAPDATEFVLRLPARAP